ncbi:MAG: hypothetical protein K2H09_04915, partial [Treponemataceae bacterium]|nr:hypothetical protein [Treponemataceae bacterium]
MDAMHYFIVNKTGGSGKAGRTWERVRRILERLGAEYELHESTGAGSARAIAEGLLARNAGVVRIVVVGGDGTINEVLNGVSDFSRVRLGVIPTGSGNDFARGAGIPRHFYNTPRALGMILASDGSSAVDVGRLSIVEGGAAGTSFLFGISAGLGLDALVCKKTASSRLKFVLNRLHLGGLTYLLLTVQSLFSMTFTRARVMLDGVEQDFGRLIFLAAMNMRAEGGGVKMAPDARADDGRLSVCAACGIPRFAAFFALPFLAAGRHRRLRGFFLRNFRVLELSA